MSNFKDLLAKPLPSAQKAKSVTEGVEDTENIGVPEVDDSIAADAGEELGGEECPTCGSETDTTVPTTNSDDEICDELTPEESQRVDDLMNAIATPLLIKSELNEEEIKEFVESVDCDIAEAEGMLLERTIVKFDKNARKAQLYEVAVAACAREKKDPLMKKLDTVYRMERIIKAKLRKKYNAPAQKKVKEYIARAKKSKSGILAKIAAKLSGIGKKDKDN